MPERLSHQLTERGVITADTAEQALLHQVMHGGALDTAILELDLAGEGAVMDALAAAYPQPVAAPEALDEPAEPRALRALPEQWAIKHELAPLGLAGDTLYVLSCAPVDAGRLRRLGELLDLKLVAHISTELRVQERLSALYERPLPERFERLERQLRGELTGPVEPPPITADISEAPLSLPEAEALLARAHDRDRMLLVALRYALSQLDFAAFFVPQHELLEGLIGLGQGGDRVRGLQVALHPRSAFGIVIDNAAQYLGPLPKLPTHQALSAQLGRPLPPSALILPLRMRGRVVALLYGEGGERGISPQLAGELMLFMTQVEVALAQLLTESKRPHSVAPAEPLPIPPLVQPEPLPEPPAEPPAAAVEVDLQDLETAPPESPPPVAEEAPAPEAWAAEIPSAFGGLGIVAVPEPHTAPPPQDYPQVALVGAPQEIHEHSTLPPAHEESTEDGPITAPAATSEPPAAEDEGVGAEAEGPQTAPDGQAEEAALEGPKTAPEPYLGEEAGPNTTPQPLLSSADPSADLLKDAETPSQDAGVDPSADLIEAAEGSQDTLQTSVVDPSADLIEDPGPNTGPQLGLQSPSTDPIEPLHEGEDDEPAPGPTEDLPLSGEHESATEDLPLDGLAPAELAAVVGTAPIAMEVAAPEEPTARGSLIEGHDTTDLSGEDTPARSATQPGTLLEDTISAGGATGYTGQTTADAAAEPDAGVDPDVEAAAELDEEALGPLDAAQDALTAENPADAPDVFPGPDLLDDAGAPEDEPATATESTPEELDAGAVDAQVPELAEAAMLDAAADAGEAEPEPRADAPSDDTQEQTPEPDEDLPPLTAEAVDEDGPLPFLMADAGDTAEYDAPDSPLLLSEAPDDSGAFSIEDTGELVDEWKQEPSPPSGLLGPRWAKQSQLAIPDDPNAEWASVDLEPPEEADAAYEETGDPAPQDPDWKPSLEGFEPGHALLGPEGLEASDPDSDEDDPGPDTDEGGLLQALSDLPGSHLSGARAILVEDRTVPDLSAEAWIRAATEVAGPSRPTAPELLELASRPPAPRAEDGPFETPQPPEIAPTEAVVERTEVTAQPSFSSAPPTEDEEAAKQTPAPEATEVLDEPKDPERERTEVVRGDPIKEDSPPNARIALETALSDLDSPLEHLQKQAVHQLSSVVGPTVLPELIERFPGRLRVDPFATQDELPPFAQCSPLLEVIANFGPQAHLYVRQRLEAKDRVARFFATYFYAAVYLPEAIPKLLHRLHDGESRICMLAARTLFRYREHPSFQLVQTHVRGRLDASSIGARRHATFLAGLFRDTSLIPRLIKVFEDRDKPMYALTEQALGEITKQRFGSSARRWNSWWSKHRSESRIQWLIDGLSSREEQLRRSSVEELRVVSEEYMGFDPEGPRRDREAARKLWLSWWEEYQEQR